MTGEPTKADYQELAEFRYRLRRFLQFSEQAAQDAGITPNQHQLLLAIAGHPDRDWMTPREIADRLLIRHHSALGLIQRTEKLGLVTRFAHPTDGRSVCIALTEKGRALLAELTTRHERELRRLGLSDRSLGSSDLSVLGDTGGEFHARTDRRHG
ncbi:MAG: MarR family transcriptional regulator [Alicyclobacillus sp.]|nr:MarR family transcriptional regulator [Alicyclobacillus sp.]